MKQFKSFKVSNFFESIPETLNKELIETIFEKGNDFKIERIISKGQVSPKDFWYNQSTNEWLIVLQGNALLRFEKEPDLILLKKGDFLNIKAYEKHRVEWTDENVTTLWLAIHYL